MHTASMDLIRAAMHARAAWPEAQAEFFVPTATLPNGHQTEHRDLGIQWRRLELRLFGLALAPSSIVRGDD